jgi:outer membrane immunogenic protein
MRKIYLTTAAIVAISSSTAMAADLGAMPTKAFPAAAAPWSWTGVYVGLNAGYATGNSNPTATLQDYLPVSSFGVLATPSLKPSGFIGGGQVGYNWQTGPWMLGAEVDFSGINAKSERHVDSFFSGKHGTTATYSSQYDWLFTARLRAGVTVAQNWLLYVTGGLAMTHVHDTIAGFPGGPDLVTWSDSKTLFGGAIGGGVEYAFSQNWSFKAEYLYTKFNDTQPTITDTSIIGAAPPIANFRHDLSVVRAGINYKFGG